MFICVSVTDLSAKQYETRLAPNDSLIDLSPHKPLEIGFGVYFYYYSTYDFINYFSLLLNLKVFLCLYFQNRYFLLVSEEEEENRRMFAKKFFLLLIFLKI